MGEDSRRLVDVVKWGQSYIENKDSKLKQRITDAASNIASLYMSISTEGLNRAIKEGMEEAIFYNPAKDIYRLFDLKEITEDEYNNNPIKKAYDEYAGAIIFRFGDLDISCVLTAITETDNIPTYKNAVKKALKIAENHIKTLCKETGCNIKIASYFGRELIKRTCSIAYDIYHREEFDEFHSYITQNSKMSMSLLESITLPTNDPKNDEYYKEKDRLEKELNKKIAQYQKNIYKADEVTEITEAIIIRLFPGEEIPDFLKNSEIEMFKIPVTKFPNNLVIPKDKVSNKLFEGELTTGVLNPVATENKKSKRELTAVVSIDFDELKGVAISRNLTPYDREVHDAIVSLYVEGGNQYITPLMIYRTMTGNQKAKLTPKHQEAINESVTKCSITRIRIDAKDEAKAYNMHKLIYEGNLIYTKKVTGIHKGETSEWIYIMEQPVLYDYANSKGQIDRPSITLLNTPVSKNEETIILQGYLLRRIRTMKKSKLSRNILYETIYKQLDIKAASKASLDNKHRKIRNTVKEILDYWIKEKEIKSFSENKGKNNSIISLTIQID